MKILFFVGPPKTGTTYLYRKFQEQNDRDLIPHGWIYPACEKTLGRPTDRICRGKPFAGLVDAFRVLVLFRDPDSIETEREDDTAA